MKQEKHLLTLNISPSFEHLHLPLPEDASKNLEKTISEKGDIRPIKTWNGYIIDGHKHYRIYQKLKIPFTTREYDFSNRFDAMAWICRRNLLRYDLTDEYRKYFIGKLFNLRYESIVEAGIAGNREIAIPGALHNRCLIAKDLGEAYGISNTTIHTYSQFAEAIDKLDSMEPEISSFILRGSVKISVENIVRISQLQADDIHSLKGCFKNRNSEKRLSTAEIRKELQWNRIHSPSAVKKKPEPEKAGIKIMPKYDPDAELSSLSLTIPTWKSSIERVDTKADFSHSSENARKKLLKQLSNLSDTVTHITKHIKETENAQLFRTGSEPETEPGTEPGAEPEPLCTECTLRADTDKEPRFEPGIPA